MVGAKQLTCGPCTKQVWMPQCGGNIDTVHLLALVEQAGMRQDSTTPAMICPTVVTTAGIACANLKAGLQLFTFFIQCRRCFRY